MIKENFIKLYENSFHENWDLPCYTDYGDNILQDFNPSDVHHIVNHSESVFLFTSDTIWENLEEEKLTGLRGVFSLSDFRCLYQRDGETIQKFIKHLDEEMHHTYPKGFQREDVQYTTLSNDKVMLLNYTSGTTGFRQRYFRYPYRATEKRR